MSYGEAGMVHFVRLRVLTCGSTASDRASQKPPHSVNTRGYPCTMVRGEGKKVT
jgi:hypothetical protein